MSTKSKSKSKPKQKAEEASYGRAPAALAYKFTEVATGLMEFTPSERLAFTKSFVIMVSGEADPQVAKKLYTLLQAALAEHDAEFA